MEAMSNEIAEADCFALSVGQRVLHFYQGDRLATEVGAQESRSVMRGEDVAVAQCNEGSGKQVMLLQTDLVGSVLGVRTLMLQALAILTLWMSRDRSGFNVA